MELNPLTPDSSQTNYAPIKKNIGNTAHEKYLAGLCEKSFLSLWSYPGVFRNQGQKSQNGDGKEICDLLIVFGRHIIIFSDKNCAFPKTGNRNLDWQRWFRRAIQASAEQAWGAERWIRTNPSRVFIDRKCIHPLPFELPAMDTAIFHLIVVAHGISEHIREFFQGSGSLLVDSTIRGFDNHIEPFAVGDLEPTKSFVHVLDDESLNILLTTRDTISDFVEYLEKRRALLRDPIGIIAPGEEELLATYLSKVNSSDQHDFIFEYPKNNLPTLISIPEGEWKRFQKNPMRIAQLRADKISYGWDRIIERFSHYALIGQQTYTPNGGIRETEKILRFMAALPRFKRRYVFGALMDMLQTTPNDKRRIRVIVPSEGDATAYFVFLLLPLPPPHISHEHYRKIRSDILGSCCLTVKLMHPGATQIVGIATETGLSNVDRSEDASYLDASKWTDEMNQEAIEAREHHKILLKPDEMRVRIPEYPKPRPFEGPLFEKSKE